MSRLEQHPDAILQRFIELHRRTEGLQAAKKILTAQRGDDSLSRFLNTHPGNGTPLGDSGQEKLEKLRSLLSDDVEKYAVELVLGAFGSIFSDKGHKVLRDLSLAFKTLDDLARLALLYEGFSSESEGWDGPRPWAGDDGN